MMTYKHFSSLLLLGFLAGCSSRPTPPAEVVYDQLPTGYHIVRPGDSIVTIAAKYNMNKNELIRLNGLKAPYRLVKGQRLLITKNKSEDSGAGRQPAQQVSESGDVAVSALPPPPGVAETPLPDADKTMSSTAETEEETGVKSGDKIAIPPSSHKMMWPVQGKIVKDFSTTSSNRGNDGINIAAPKNTPVKACDNGVVVGMGNQLKGFGNYVLLKHEGDLISVYTHLDEITVEKGDTVQRGQKIGRVGMTGQVREPQIHFEIRQGKNRTPIDPKPFLALTLD